MNAYEPFSFAKNLGTTIGFEPILKRLNALAADLPKIPTFPPYNIKKLSDSKYAIELAVAGLSKSDIEIEMKDGTLTIRGKSDSTADLDSYIVKGIADRAFTRQFTLADTIEVKNAELVNGMLKIMLEQFIPEEKKAKKIEIDDNASSSHPD
jgi:molecular chaperone IbpA